LRGARRARLAAAVSEGARNLLNAPSEPLSLDHSAPIAEEPGFGAQTVTSEIRTSAYFVAFIGGVLLFGFHVAVPILVALYLCLEAKLRTMAAGLAAVVFTLAIYLMFERLLEFRLHEGFLTERLINALAL
jgi:hypothetical protein